MMVLLKIVILLLVISIGAFYVNPNNWHPFAPNGLTGVLKGISGVFFAYIGFDAISTTAEECKNPKRDIPLSMFLSLLITTVLYILLCLVLTGMVNYKDLGVADVYQGARFKTEALRELIRRYDLSSSEVGYICDDLNDLPAFKVAGVSFAVRNAVSEVKEVADVVTVNSGGAGAVREVIELILKAQGKWKDAVASMLDEFKREQSTGKVEKAAG
jgi:amino acid transporter